MKESRVVDAAFVIEGCKNAKHFTSAFHLQTVSQKRDSWWSITSTHANRHRIIRNDELSANVNSVHPQKCKSVTSVELDIVPHHHLLVIHFYGAKVFH